MRLERTFPVPEDETTIRTRVAAFLEQSGYKPVASQPLIIYRRGNVLGFASFSPSGWRVKATIQIVPSSGQNQVIATFDVDTTLQWVTDKERGFWKSELDCLQAAAITGVTDTALSTKSAQSARTQNYLAYMLIIALALGFGMGARLLFGSSAALWAGVVVGAVTAILIAGRWMNFRIGGG